MLNKIKRLSYNQLLILSAFLKKDGSVVTLSYLEKSTKIAGKSLGGVISSLSRTHFRSLNLIEPVGADMSGSGLRWILNDKVLDGVSAKAEVARLLKLYQK
jgi:hypothetical protein